MESCRCLEPSYFTKRKSKIDETYFKVAGVASHLKISKLEPCCHLGSQRIRSPLLCGEEQTTLIGVVNCRSQMMCSKVMATEAAWSDRRLHPQWALACVQEFILCAWALLPLFWSLNFENALSSEGGLSSFLRLSCFGLIKKVKMWVRERSKMLTLG